jgi:hypothetical protein
VLGVQGMGLAPISSGMAEVRFMAHDPIRSPAPSRPHWHAATHPLNIQRCNSQVVATVLKAGHPPMVPAPAARAIATPENCSPLREPLGMLWMLHPDRQARQCVATSCVLGAVIWLARVGAPQPSGK